VLTFREQDSKTFGLHPAGALGLSVAEAGQRDAPHEVALHAIRSGCNILKSICEIAARRRRWQRASVGSVDVQDFLDDLAQLVEHLPLVISVAAAEEQPGTAPDVAAVLVGPFDNLHVPRAVFHNLASLTARRTARI
jgi:hypothetical protein